MDDFFDSIDPEGAEERNKLNRKIERWNSALITIENRHLYFFEGRTQEGHAELPDTITAHIGIWTNNNSVRYEFAPGSDLPDNIKQECVGAFHEIFGR